MAELIGVVASVIAILQTTKKVTNFIDDVKESSVERTNFRDEMSSAAFLVGALKDRFGEGRGERQQLHTVDPLVSVYGDLERMKTLVETMHMKLNSTYGNRLWKDALIWPFQKKGMLRMLSEIYRFKINFILALQCDTRLVLPKLFGLLHAY